MKERGEIEVVENLSGKARELFFWFLLLGVAGFLMLCFLVALVLAALIEVRLAVLLIPLLVAITATVRYAKAFAFHQEYRHTATTPADARVLADAIDKIAPPVLSNELKALLPGNDKSKTATTPAQQNLF